MKFKYLLFCFFIIQLIGSKAFSACNTSNPSGSTNGYFNVYIPDDTIIIQYDDTSVRTLKSYNVIAFAGVVDFATPSSSCFGASIARYQAPWTNVNPSPSNISGVAIDVGYITGQSSFYSLPHTIQSSASTRWDGFTWVVNIKKTGRVMSSGVIRNGIISAINKNIADSTMVLGISTLNFRSNFRIVVTSCSLKNNTSSHNINMKDWFDGDFPNIGSVSDSIDIPIALTCQAGANVKATVTSSAGYADANTGKLNLTGSNSAKGIAIQLLDKDRNPIKLNSQISLQNDVPAGDYLFNWTARYIRTGDKITLGTANSTATVNIQYQ